MSHVGLLVVAVQADHVALPEVERCAGGLTVVGYGGVHDAEPDGLFAGGLCARCLLELRYDDVAGLRLLVGRHQPEVGRAASGVVQPRFGRAQLGGHLLAVDEGEHPLEVGALQWRELHQALVEGVEPWLHVAVEEAVARDTIIYDIVIEQGQYAPEALACHEQLGGHYLVAQLQRLAQQRAVVVHAEQPLVGGISRIEQPHVDMSVVAPEVIAQHAVVEQQLHVVALQLQSVSVVALVLNLHVLSRLLLYEQPHVGGHQVNAPLQPQSLADEAGLQQVAAVVSRRAEVGAGGVGLDGVCGLAYVAHLLLCLLLELRGVEVGACQQSQRLFAKRALQCRCRGGALAVADDVVEGCTGEVTQQGGLRVGLLLQPVQRVVQGVVSVGCEACRERRYVNEEVGLYDDLSRHECHRQLILPCCCVLLLQHVAVEQVQLHARAQHLCQVAEVAAVAGVADVDADGAVGGVCPDGHGCSVADDAAHVGHVDAQSFLSRSGTRWQQGAQRPRHGGGEDGLDESHHGLHVVAPFLGGYGRCGRVGVASCRLQADGLLGAQP